MMIAMLMRTPRFLPLAPASANVPAAAVVTRRDALSQWERARGETPSPFRKRCVGASS
jgi:hypothetical protein